MNTSATTFAKNVTFDDLPWENATMTMALPVEHVEPSTPGSGPVILMTLRNRAGYSEDRYDYVSNLPIEVRREYERQMSMSTHQRLLVALAIKMRRVEMALRTLNPELCSKLSALANTMADAPRGNTHGASSADLESVISYFIGSDADMARSILDAFGA